MEYAAIIQAIVSVVGEILGTGKEQEAEALLNQMRKQFADVPLPTLDEIKAEQLGPSKMAGVTTDPALEAAQYDALGQLGEVAQTGLADADTAILNRIANQVARRQQAGMAGIESDMAARGQAGTGLDYGVRAQAASDANQRLSEEGQSAGGSALQRRFQAMLQRGQQAGQMRGQSFGEQSQKAQAEDLINRLNAASRSQAQYHNAGLPQQRWQNQMQRTGAMANPTNALVGFKAGQAKDTREAFGGYGAAAGKAVESSYEGDETADERRRRRQWEDAQDNYNDDD